MAESPPKSTNGVKTINQSDDDQTAANPMLYGPLHGAKISKTNQFIATAIICLSAVGAGTGLSWTSPVLTQLDDLNGTRISGNGTLYVTGEQQTWIASFLAIGALAGAVPAGLLADRIGRKYTAILIGFPFIVSWFLTVTASNAFMLYVARFMMGISTGGSCVVTPVFVSEFAETSIRGLLGTGFQLFLTMGILLVYVVGAITSWVNLSIVCGVVPILYTVGMLFVPESPTWLVKNNRHEDAARSIKWFWGKYCDSNAAIQEIQGDLEASGGSGGIRDLFAVPANRRGFSISLALMFFQQFSGINAVIFYTVPIFKSAGSTMDANLSAIIVGVVQVLMTFVSATLVERAGRKVLLIQSSAVMGLCLAVLGVYFRMKDGGTDVSSIGWIPLFSMVMFIVSFSLGYGPIPWMMMGELLAPEVKGIATSLVVLFNWVAVFVVTKSFTVMVAGLGSAVTFWCFSIVMAVGTYYGLRILFETKGKSNAQIQLILSGEK